MEGTIENEKFNLSDEEAKHLKARRKQMESERSEGERVEQLLTSKGVMSKEDREFLLTQIRKAL